jgi:hypothetical protein
MPEPKPEGPPPPTVTTPFEAPSEYAAAYDQLVGLATAELLIFDRDLHDGGWNSVQRHDALRDFVLRGRGTRLQIVVHETAFIEGHLPRLIILLRDFSHKFEIRRTTGDGRNAWDAFALADGRHVLHRFHQDLMRGELLLHAPARARELRERYDEIVTFSEPGVNATQLGL